METTTRLLVPLDGSDLSRWVLSCAGRLIERSGTSVTLLGVVESEEGRSEDLSYRVSPAHRKFRDELARLRDGLADRSIAATAEMRFGDPATEILREISAGKHDLVVMATHGRTGLKKVMFGSVAEKVLRASPAPVLLFKPLQRPDGTISPVETGEPVGFKRILVPLDGSPAAEEVIPVVRTFAKRFGSKLVFFRAVAGGPDEASRTKVAEEYLLAWVRRLGGHDLAAASEVRTGPAAQEALEVIRLQGLDAVAMTTHGRTGMARAIYGSVAERLLRDGEVPVLLFRSVAGRATMPSPAEAGDFTRV